MKKILLFLTVTITTLSACNNNDVNRKKLVEKAMTDTANYTSIKWLDTLLDLGTISAGDIKELKFRCLNTGNKPLILGNVTAGCGCTVADYSKEAIEPGKEGWVAAKFNSKKQCDDVIKHIMVPSNATNDTLRTLAFKAHIINCESNDKVVIPHPVND